MKKLGIIAGLGPESTIEYYKSIIKTFQEKLSTNEYPEMILHSINMTEMFRYLLAEDLEGLAVFLSNHIKVLENAHAEFVIMASNTPHLVFDRLAELVDIPMISIVEETCKFIANEHVSKVGLLGTKSTMSKGFYQRTGMKYGLEIVIPEDKTQDYIHDKYINELVLNNIIPETKRQLMKIIRNLKREQNIDGIILGGTELPLILKQKDFEDIQIFDTAQIHVNSIVNRMITK